MGLDLKNALAKRHREGRLQSSPDALLWVFTQIRQQPRLNLSEASTKTPARELTLHLWRQAQLQFGAMAEPVLANWGLTLGVGVAQCIRDLVEMDAIRLEPGESWTDYEIFGIGQLEE